MVTTTFLWHDYETWGSNPRRDRPAQFAAIRTDADLNEIGTPVMLYCQPPTDTLPSPEACLITGITPQQCAEQGLQERDFARRVLACLAEPGTIGVGYNSIRFDDEVSRFLFWRNLIEPYGREWQNGCGRWDLLDVMRLAHALRPGGITWPLNTQAGAEGKPSFKLTDLTAANGLAHEHAHDALSDVRATIALARLLKQAQPKLFDFALSLHKKDRVLHELGLPAAPQHAKPFLHVSGMFPPERGCLALMWPLAAHPVNKNEIIAWDLHNDPAALATLSAADIRTRIFTRADALPDGVQRLPIKSVHVNKSPMVVGSLKTLGAEQAARWGLDVEQQLRHAATARDLPDMSAIWQQVFAQEPAEANDVDEDLYNGFLRDADRRRLDDLRRMTGPELAQAKKAFDDPRLEELVFRYRARNFIDTLSADEAQRWHEHRVARLHDGEGGVTNIDQYFAQIDALGDTADEWGQDILGALYDWAEAIAPEL